MPTIEDYRCPYCGELLDTAGYCRNQNCQSNTGIPLRTVTYGWKCPICGKSVSPFVDVCPGPHNNYVVTDNTGE